jgi:hypothetical protein
MYPHPARIYGDIIPGSEFIRSLVRQGTITKAAAKRRQYAFSLEQGEKSGSRRLSVAREGSLIL